MKAKITFNETSIGCQNIKGNLSNTIGGGEKTIIVTFEHTDKLTFKVAALKELDKNHKPYQYGNSFTYRSNFKVELYEEEILP
jgi:hypothetical protein